MELSPPPGERITLHVSRSPLQSPSMGRVVVIRDVSLERDAAEKRAFFMSQVSHELRAPLQRILSFVSLVTDIDDLPPEDVDRYLRHVEDETYQMALLVDDLVALSRIETGRFSVHLERIRIDRWVADAFSRFAPRALLRDHILELENVEGPTWVETDPMRVAQVLENLVGNAHKFVPAGGRIRIGVACDDTSLTINVSDTGPGMPHDKLARIFDAFYQTHRGAQHRRGMGLGLYISREIVHSLGGEIWAESELGVGSTFAFRLPRAGD